MAATRSLVLLALVATALLASPAAANIQLPLPPGFKIPPLSLPPLTLPPLPKLPPLPPRTCPASGCSNSVTVGTPVVGFPLAKTTAADAAACATYCKSTTGATYYEFTNSATVFPNLPPALQAIQRKAGDCACYSKCTAALLLPNVGSITSGFQASCP